jgi:lipoyl(octanoyl) transferase
LHSCQVFAETINGEEHGFDFCAATPVVHIRQVPAANVRQRIPGMAIWHGEAPHVAVPMSSTPTFRDISVPPSDSAGQPLRRPRRDLPFIAASDAHPLLAAHGGVLTVERLGTVPYQPAWELQDELADQRQRRRIGDRLLLLEHFPVYTIGRGGDEHNLLAGPDRLRELGAEFVRIDRGGDVTFHGPGQLVAYPIVELRDPLDLRRYVRSLEAAIVEAAAAFGVTAGRVEGLTGVWVAEQRKLAAIGVRVRRGVTTHGLALNVNTRLAWFDEMIPCGIRDKEVTSLAGELGRAVPMEAVEKALAASLARAFGLRLADGSPGITGPAGASEQ